MLINVLNGSLKKVAILSNELPNAPSYYNDEFHDYLEQGATTFSFTVAKVINNQLQDYTQFLSDQSYFSFRKNGRDYLMTPSSAQSVHETSTEISFFCVSLDRELINEQANPLANTESHNIQWYFDRMGLISRTKITIGINEVSNLTRVINYDAQESKLSRLISVINNFNAEFDFVTTLNNDGSLGTVVLNIYKENDGQNIQGVGTKRDDVRLTFGKNIEDVEVDVSDDGFFNAAYMTGADGFSWKNYDFSYKNSDGVEEFYKRKGSEIAYAPLSAKMFPSQLKTDKGDIWTNSDRTTEYKNANDMWGYIVSQFKQYAYKQITYTVTPSSTLVNQLIGDGRPLQKGDTVIIQDDNYMDIDGNVGLILSARVSEIITSDTNPANNKIVFSNYKKLKSEASSDIKAVVSQLVNDATPYFADIATSNGVQFKNGTGSTTLSAHIYKGSATTEATADSYEWSKDGTVVAPTQTITVDASGVADKAVYSFKATVAGKVVASQSVTITNVNDGTNGRSVTNVSQKWRLTTTTATPTQAWSDAGWLTTQPTTTATNKYLWSITRTTFNLAPLTQDVIEQKAVYGDKGDKGDTGNDGRAGKDGVGINSTTITYAISSSGTVTPTAGWNSQVPTLVKGQYLWTKTVWNYSDGTSESGYTVSYIAKDGNNGNDGIAGKDGTGIKTTTITYAGSTSGTTAPTSGWTSTVPTVAAGSYLWTKTVWAYTDNTSETGYSVAMMGVKGDKGDQGIQGVDGRQGVPGPKGADGKTQYTHIAYANSADGSKNFSTSDSNRTYIGMYVDFNINDSTTPSDYSWTLVKGADGTQGTPGKPGTDGKTPYFHTAWSYSADGTDGFTTVYPNLNLGDNTKTFVGAEYELSNIRGSIRIDPATQKTQDGDFYHLTVKAPRDNYDWFRFYLRPNSTMPNMTKVAIKPNTKYTFSVLLKGTGQHTIYAYQNWTAPNTPWTLQINLTSEWKIYTFTVTSSNVIPDRDVQFFIRSNNGTEINLKYPKVEEGSTATPYMQSASEVTTADYPSYIGQYTDFTQADSTNPSDYTWSLIRGNDGERGPQGLKGDPGATGIPGQPGADGKTSYLHIAYATNSTGTAGFDVSNATGKTYIGQYTDFTSADSTDPSKYTWSLIKGDKGDKGDTGPQGPQGERGIAGATGATGSPGPKGADGRSSYIHIKYAPVINPTDSQITDTPNAYIGVYTDYNQADSTSASAYTWSKWQGEDGANGVAGAKGADGRTTYVHFAYANSTNGQTNFSTSYFDGALYMGTLTDYTQTDSTNYAAYTWSRLKGDKGDKGDQGAQGIQGLQGPTGTQGVAGPKGADGKTQYTHIAYANSANGVTDFSTSDSNRAYIGMYVDFNVNDSTTPSDYSWTLVKGADGTQGTPGKPGADGKTPYFHTAWSYSADGTDSFMTVYPNLNLGDNTKTFVGADNGNNVTGSIKIEPGTKKTLEGDFYYLTAKAPRDNYDWFRFFLIPYPATPNMTKVTVKPNTNYTFSVWLKGTGQHTIYAYNSWTAPNTPWSLQINLTSDWKLYTFTVTSKDVIPNNPVQFFIRSNNGTEINLKYPKVEEGSTATPYMQSASEVTTADYPSYIGQYTDFTQADSTKPSDYTWSLIRGNDGERGPQGLKGDPGATGIPGQAGADGKTSYLHIAYATNSTGTSGFDVSNATGKTYIGQYTDFTSADSTDPSKYTWSLIKGDKGDKGAQGNTGPQGPTGPAGSTGNPGKVVSDTEPTTKFVGLTWKYSGITAVDAYDGTNIQPNTEYYWNGKNWVIYLINAQNIDVEKLTALTANLGDATAGSLTVEKGATGGIAVKDGLVKSWDISKMTDPNYPDGYSYTSMGVALDSGGLTFYSAGYGHTLDKGGVIDSQYKVASLQAIASNGRNSIGTGLVLNATNSNFPFTINGNIDVIGGIRQTSKTASVTIGAGLILNLERRGDIVEATLSGYINSPLSSNTNFTVGTIPVGYRPNSTAYIMVHMTSSVNSSHIDVGTNGVCTWWGTSTNTGAPRGHQMWFTNDSLPN